MSAQASSSSSFSSYWGEFFKAEEGVQEKRLPKILLYEDNARIMPHRRAKISSHRFDKAEEAINDSDCSRLAFQYLIIEETFGDNDTCASSITNTTCSSLSLPSKKKCTSDHCGTNNNTNHSIYNTKTSLVSTTSSRWDTGCSILSKDSKNIVVKEEEDLKSNEREIFLKCPQRQNSFYSRKSRICTKTIEEKDLLQQRKASLEELPIAGKTIGAKTA